MLVGRLHFCLFCAASERAHHLKASFPVKQKWDASLMTGKAVEVKAISMRSGETERVRRRLRLNLCSLTTQEESVFHD